MWSGCILSLRSMALTSACRVHGFGKYLSAWSNQRPAFIKNLNSFQWILKIPAARDPSTKLWICRGHFVRFGYITPPPACRALVRGPRDTSKKPWRVTRICPDLTAFGWSFELRSPLQAIKALLPGWGSLSLGLQAQFKTRYHEIFLKYWLSHG